jgi:signal transduction histidine kinase
VVAVSLDRMANYSALSRSYAELRTSREILAQGEKLRALSQMAAGVSHDLESILNAIALQLELLRRRLEEATRGCGRGDGSDGRGHPIGSREMG